MPLIISHFGAGLKDEISFVVLGQADAPNNVRGMLEAAEAVEAKQAKDGNPENLCPYCTCRGIRPRSTCRSYC